MVLKQKHLCFSLAGEERKRGYFHHISKADVHPAMRVKESLSKIDLALKRNLIIRLDSGNCCKLLVTVWTHNGSVFVTFYLVFWPAAFVGQSERQ